MNILLKRSFLWILPSILLIQSSCHKTSTSMQLKSGQINYLTLDSTSFALVPIDLARKVAMYRPKDSTAITLTENLAGRKPRAIKSEFTYSGQQGYPSCYVFNYSDGGFIVISADLKLQPILAFVPLGAWDAKKLPDGVNFWIRKSSALVDYLRNKSKPISDYTSMLWSHVLPEITLPAATQGTKTTAKNPGPCQTESIEYYYGPLVQTAWGQGCGYNGQCPYDPTSPECNFDLTGCVATAMAQIAYYNQTPATYAYATMPLNMESGQVNSPALQQLMANMGADVNMQYGPQASSIPLANSPDIATAFTNTLGYAGATFSVVTGDIGSTVEANINARHPLIMIGTDPNAGGHCWVVDGYSTVFNQYPPCNTTLTLFYYHMNWGWGEAGTTNTYIGWYDTGDWSVNGTDFNGNLELITNIVP
jgi:hypothetical protein